MRAETLKESIVEAKRFVEGAEKVAIYMSPASGYEYVNSGKASGACIRASMDLTRKLADLRQGR